MHNDLKNIHLGTLLYTRVKEMDIGKERICNFLKCSESELEKMYISENLDTGVLLRWCKLLKYDFFRLYSQHLILYSPPQGKVETRIIKKTILPKFRKHIYTREIIDFMIELYTNEQKTKEEIMKEYGIPKSTLHKWIAKYSKDENTK